MVTTTIEPSRAAVLAFKLLWPEDRKLIDHRLVGKLITSYYRIRDRQRSWERDKGVAIQNALAAHYINKKSTEIYSAYARLLRKVRRRTNAIKNRKKNPAQKVQPIVISASVEGCIVILQGWVIGGSTTKPLEEKLNWEDVRCEIDTEETFARLALNRFVVPREQLQVHVAKKRILGVIGTERARELLKRAAETTRTVEIELDLTTT